MKYSERAKRQCKNGFGKTLNRAWVGRHWTRQRYETWLNSTSPPVDHS